MRRSPTPSTRHARIAQVLENHPHLVGTCVDRPDVAARASAYLSNVAGAEAFAGSFFEQLPAGDVYVLKWSLCGNRISRAPRHRRDVVSVAVSARWRGAFAIDKTLSP